MLLKVIASNEFESFCFTRPAIDTATLAAAKQIVDRVRKEGFAGLESCAAEFDGWCPPSRLLYGPQDFSQALKRISQKHRQVLERTASRIRFFAERQLTMFQSFKTENCGSRMGQSWHPLRTAGCYVPGGRYPLVSSLLMTSVTARTAGVESVWEASPVATDLMLAAAGICQVDGFLAAGGAQAIAALSYGVGPIPAADVVVGPGNRWVTAAKQLVSADVKIDMLAGPSELVVLADDSAEAAIVAADLLAQAEHDTDARPILVTTSVELLAAVEQQLVLQLAELPTAETARAALANGFAVLAAELSDAIRVCETIAPEHLELQVCDAQQAAKMISRCGCIFIGPQTGEVFGDYGAGPNHVLPTGGTARHTSGLSVATFLRSQTWLELGDSVEAAELLSDSIQLANLEGLSGHARSAAARMNQATGNSNRA